MSAKTVFVTAIILALIPLLFGIYDYIREKRVNEEIKERLQNGRPLSSEYHNDSESDESTTNTAALGFTAVQM